MIGLARGTVKLCEHEKEWELEAQNTISRLKNILGNVIKDIQHVGSTSILSIKAQPIIDIAVAVDVFDDILGFEKELKNVGFYYRPKAQASIKGQLLFACGNFYEGTGDLQTHFIHVVRTNSTLSLQVTIWSEGINYESCRAALTPYTPDTCRFRALHETNYMPSESGDLKRREFLHFQGRRRSVPGSTLIEDNAENEEIIPF